MPLSTRETEQLNFFVLKTSLSVTKVQKMKSQRAGFNVSVSVTLTIATSPHLYGMRVCFLHLGIE